MKVYRIKHVPTGMYFCPSRKISGKANKDWKIISVCYASNLSNKGKLYTKKPSFGYVASGYYSHLDVYPYSSYADPILHPYVAGEWVIEEIA